MATTKSSSTATAAPKAAEVNPRDLFTFPAGDIEITVTYKGELIIGKVASNILLLSSSPARSG